jgi:hypothetical protein
MAELFARDAHKAQAAAVVHSRIAETPKRDRRGPPHASNCRTSESTSAHRPTGAAGAAGRRAPVPRSES